ncbi:hypothetical protein STTU_0802 [Streptomyces sp. Tu6071]|uniref:hypothetical protein n=1 Tax=Streptomyces sp. Tu6071 TaxID=355249 RepID=UPI00020E5451|nr:hypothetical protein [Streptomyces sp. Tu6071]EGJ73591.1 hypothetical protein STTU_0802 [Streptomyces sp. Tu6071]
MADAEFTFSKGWETEVFRSEYAREAVAVHTADIMKLSIANAPRGSFKRDNWNAIRKSISMSLDKSLKGWHGNVIIEDNEKVRHALLQEGGYRDPKGRRHPGRHYLKKALERARIE